MKQLLGAALWFGIGYLTVTKLMPLLQAKIESINLDEMWDVYSAEWADD